MKTKFIVSSSSGLNYITHKSNIEVLNYYIYFNGFENYEDFKELKYDEFYTRLRYDLNSEITFKDLDYEKFDSIIKKSFESGYDNIILIINEKETRLLEFINSYKTKMPEANIDVIITNLYLYPLAYGVIESEKIYSKDNDINEIFELIKSLEDKFKMYIYVPEKTLYQEISSIEYDEDVINVKSGLLYDSNKDGELLLKKYKNNMPFKYMLEAFIKEISGIDVIPFILYTDSNSRFVSLIKKKLLALNLIKNEKEVISGYIDSKFGVKYGPNSLVLGFIMK